MPLTTSNKPAGADGGDDPFSVERIARLICEASGQNPDQCVHGFGMVSFGGDGKQTYAESKCYRRAWENHISPANAVIARYAALASTARAGAGDWVTVPRDAPEAMWGGLARQIVMWCRFGQPTGKALFQHLKSSGYEIPAWLREEVEDVDHVPPKGTIAVIIYRAMIEAAPNGPEDPRTEIGR